MPPVPSILPNRLTLRMPYGGWRGVVAARYPMVMREPTVNPIASATSPDHHAPASGHAPFTFNGGLVAIWVGFTPASTYDDAFANVSYRYVAYAAVLWHAPFRSYV